MDLGTKRYNKRNALKKTACLSTTKLRWLACVAILTYVSIALYLHISLDGLTSSLQDVPQLLGQSMHRKPTKGGKPKLFLHVGPRKTATSTMQLTYFKPRDRLWNSTKKKNNNIYKSAVTADNLYVFDFNWGSIISIITDCFRPLTMMSSVAASTDNDNQTAVCDTWDMLMGEKLDEVHKMGMNVIISNEGFSLVPKERNRVISGMFRKLQEKWDVTVFVTYRPLETWYYSIYREQRSQGMINKGTEDWRRFQYSYPFDITIPDWFDLYWGGPNQSELRKRYVARGDVSGLGLGEPLETKELYESIFGRDRVKTIMLYPSKDDKRDFAERFICDDLLNAKNACNLTRVVGPPIARRKGDEFDFDEDLLLMRAFREGLIPRKASPFLRIGCIYPQRHGVVERLKKKMRELETDILDFPRLCLSSERLEELKRRSWDAEMAMAEPPRSREEFERDFNKASKRYCTLDPDKALDVDWVRPYLESEAFRRNCQDERLTAKKSHYFCHNESERRTLAARACNEPYIKNLWTRYPPKHTPTQ